MNKPHYLLFADGIEPNAAAAAGRWRFVLEASDGSTKLHASDEEPRSTANRLALLAIVRGLEALDQPSRVTLVTGSGYVSRGMRSGLDEWRRNDWRWERYGTLAPVKNGDLWQRIDRAVRIHQVQCRTIRRVPDQATRPGGQDHPPERPTPPRRQWTRRIRELAERCGRVAAACVT